MRELKFHLEVRLGDETDSVEISSDPEIIYLAMKRAVEKKEADDEMLNCEGCGNKFDLGADDKYCSIDCLEESAMEDHVNNEEARREE